MIDTAASASREKASVASLARSRRRRSGQHLRAVYDATAAKLLACAFVSPEIAQAAEDVLQQVYLGGLGPRRALRSRTREPDHLGYAQSPETPRSTGGGPTAQRRICPKARRRRSSMTARWRPSDRRRCAARADLRCLDALEDRLRVARSARPSSMGSPIRSSRRQWRCRSARSRAGCAAARSSSGSAWAMPEPMTWKSAMRSPPNSHLVCSKAMREPRLCGCACPTRFRRGRRGLGRALRAIVRAVRRRSPLPHYGRLSSDAWSVVWTARHTPARAPALADQRGCERRAGRFACRDRRCCARACTWWRSSALPDRAAGHRPARQRRCARIACRGL